MEIRDVTLIERLELGEDGGWVFKQIEFCATNPKSLQRNNIADEMTAFANTEGGIILFGVTDNGQIQDMTLQQMRNLAKWLAELCTDLIEPPLRVFISNRKLYDKYLVLVKVARGHDVHERSGVAYIRVGKTKRKLNSDERLRLSQHRALCRYKWFDCQIVGETGFNTLEERLWEPLISIVGANDPCQSLTNLRLLSVDEFDVIRATVAGVLFCTKSPQDMFSQAVIMATHYRGKDRASGQLDAQVIEGPLQEQVANACRFVFRNMRVAARKVPEREEMPQYSKEAVFEAVVNAVVHRDYSIVSRRIRLSMFKDRLEIDSPGKLPYGVTIDNISSNQSTRNEVIANVFGHISAVNYPGATNRTFLMERRGDGVTIILRETQEVSGELPKYELIADTNLVLTIPAAKLILTPADSMITVHSGDDLLSGVKVLAVFPNKTNVLTTTDEDGQATLKLYTTNLPMTVYVAAPGYFAKIERDWIPDQSNLLLELDFLKTGGAVIFSKGTGYIPKLRGRLNPIRDATDRTYLYADNISVEGGLQQPVPFRIGKPMRLTDSTGIESLVTIVDIVGQSALVEYRSIPKLN